MGRVCDYSNHYHIKEVCTSMQHGGGGCYAERAYRERVGGGGAMLKVPTAKMLTCSVSFLCVVGWSVRCSSWLGMTMEWLLNVASVAFSGALLPLPTFCFFLAKSLGGSGFLGLFLVMTRFEGKILKPPLVVCKNQ